MVESKPFQKPRNHVYHRNLSFVAPPLLFSEAWGPPQFQEKRSRSEKAILGALGEFRGILGAALGIGHSILGIRNSILGMASHDLINTKPTILGATLGAIPELPRTHPKDFHLPLHSRSVFSRIGVVPAHQIFGQREVLHWSRVVCGSLSLHTHTHAPIRGTACVMVLCNLFGK